MNFSVISKHGILCYRKYHLIVFCLFLWELKDHLSRVLKYHASFINTNERSFYQLLALKMIPFYSQKSKISTFSSPERFIIWTFPFVQSSCFCNNFFLSFIETYVSFNHFKDLLNLYYEKKCEAELRNFFSLNFQCLPHDICQFLWHQRSLWSRIWHFNFAETKAKTSVF